MFYVIEKYNIYQHGIHGIFNRLSDAKKQLKICQELDSDDYHEWAIIRVPLNQIPTEEEIQDDGFNDIVYNTKDNKQ